MNLTLEQPILETSSTYTTPHCKKVPLVCTLLRKGYLFAMKNGRATAPFTSSSEIRLMTRLDSDCPTGLHRCKVNILV